MTGTKRVVLHSTADTFRHRAMPSQRGLPEVANLGLFCVSADFAAGRNFPCSQFPCSENITAEIVCSSHACDREPNPISLSFGDVVRDLRN